MRVSDDEDTSRRRHRLLVVRQNVHSKSHFSKLSSTPLQGLGLMEAIYSRWVFRRLSSLKRHKESFFLSFWDLYFVNDLGIQKESLDTRRHLLIRNSSLRRIFLSR
ncbi:hypothetical protein TNCT_65911 [Trichonephila clavata]|uniref:Uncharacterized protein n=1 Tax=Trichonephila clavata TaxID=2740835 RepID=A0A8X6FDH5_TRICU|nr:hypothetical protein TNCT_65911 [Trichonephila clavata]